MRVNSHRRLPCSERSVRFTVYVATVMGSVSADEVAIRSMRLQARQLLPAMRRFCGAALECGLEVGETCSVSPQLVKPVCQRDDDARERVPRPSEIVSVQRDRSELCVTNCQLAVEIALEYVDGAGLLQSCRACRDAFCAARARGSYFDALLKDMSVVDLFSRPCKPRFASLRARADIESLVTIITHCRSRFTAFGTETWVVCFAILHLIHRRSPMCTAVAVMMRHDFSFTQGAVEEIADALACRFASDQLRWDFKTQCQSVIASLRRLASAVDKLWTHAADLAALPEWTIENINSSLDRTIPTMSDLDAASTRFHYCRTLAAFAPEVRGSGKVIWIEPFCICQPACQIARQLEGRPASKPISPPADPQANGRLQAAGPRANLQ